MWLKIKKKIKVNNMYKVNRKVKFWKVKKTFYFFSKKENKFFKIETLLYL